MAGSGASFNLEGVDRAIAGLRARVAAMEAANRGFIREAAYGVERDIKRVLGESGRHDKGTPTPAVQGGPPAVISGTLRRSVHTLFYGGLIGTYAEARVGPSAIYGRRVELDYDYPYVGLVVNSESTRMSVQLLAVKWYRRAIRG